MVNKMDELNELFDNMSINTRDLVLDVKTLAILNGVDPNQPKHKIYDVLDMMGVEMPLQLTEELVMNVSWRRLFVQTSKKEIQRLAIKVGLKDQINFPPDELLENIWLVLVDPETDTD
jgi:hypothetical protein